MTFTLAVKYKCGCTHEVPAGELSAHCPIHLGVQLRSVRPAVPSTMVHPPGKQVLIGGGVPATISAVTLRDKNAEPSYEVVWWDGRTRKVEWLSARELTTDNALTLRIGFQGGGVNGDAKALYQLGGCAAASHGACGPTTGISG